MPDAMEERVKKASSAANAKLNQAASEASAKLNKATSAAGKKVAQTAEKATEKAKAAKEKVGDSYKEEFVPKLEKAVENAKQALAALVEKMNQYSNDVSLNNSVSEAKQAVNKLVEKVLVLKDEAAEVPMRALSQAIVAANNAIERVKFAAKQYDDKHKVSERIMERIRPTIDSVSASIAELSEHTSEAASSANARLQGVNHGIRGRIASTASGALSYVVGTLAGLDMKYHITETAKEHIEQIDKRLGIQDAAKSLDQKYDIAQRAKDRTLQLDELSKGRLTASYEQGRKMATEGIEYLQEEYDKAVLAQTIGSMKQQSGESSTSTSGVQAS